MARKRSRRQRLKVMHPNCAGIDIGKDHHFVAVDPEQSEEPVREFGTFTRDLEEMAEWLKSCGVTKVEVESMRAGARIASSPRSVGRLRNSASNWSVLPRNGRLSRKPYFSAPSQSRHQAKSTIYDCHTGTTPS